MSFNTTVAINLIVNVSVDCVCMVFLAIGTWSNLVAEVNQWRKEGLRRYAGSLVNYYQWLMIGVNFALII